MSIAIRDGKLYVDTPKGTLVAYAGTDPDYPGIYIDLQRPGFGVDAPLVLTECTQTEADMREGAPHIITRIWGSVVEEEYTDRIVHTEIQDFFSVQKEDGSYEKYPVKGIA